MSRTDKIKGVIVRVVKDGQQLREARYPGNLRDTWKEDAASSDSDLVAR